MKTLTPDMLKKIYPYSSQTNRDKYLPFLHKYFSAYNFTFGQITAFLAQVGHESGQLRYVEELASGAAYEGRRDLGNTEKGDGVKFKGRGLIQITGRKNYTALDKWLHDIDVLAEGVSIVEVPEMLASYDELAVLSAFWYWDVNNLNRFSDGSESGFKKLTKAINGGYNGYADRYNLWLTIRKELAA